MQNVIEIDLMVKKQKSQWTLKGTGHLLSAGGGGGALI